MSETYADRTKPAALGFNVLSYCETAYPTPVLPVSTFFKGLVSATDSAITGAQESSRAEYFANRKHAESRLGITAAGLAAIRRKYRRTGN